MEELKKRMKKEKMTKKDVDPPEVRFQRFLSIRICFLASNAKERNGKKLDTQTQMYIEGWGATFYLRCRHKCRLSSVDDLLLRLHKRPSAPISPSVLLIWENNAPLFSVFYERQYVD